MGKRTWISLGGGLLWAIALSGCGTLHPSFSPPCASVATKSDRPAVDPHVVPALQRQIGERDKRIAELEAQLATLKVIDQDVEQRRQSSQPPPGVQGELKGSLRKVILEGYILKARIEREYRLHRREKTFEANSQDFITTWSLEVTSWAGIAEEILQKIDAVAKEQFRAYHGLPLSRGEGDEKWGNIDWWLKGKLDFLSRFYEKFG